jgi:aminoglycoside phosphotransferase family enzyme/predicted kinase
MLRPDFYPHRPSTIELVQTHISYVLLAGEEVYKVKKSVRFSFLDFSTPAQRRYYCEEEVRLNRRLAPDVYRGVVAIAATDDGFRLTDTDDPKVVDWAVWMRRLPEERMLSELLVRDEVEIEQIGAIAAKLVEFHRAADSSPQITANGAPELLAELMRRDFAEVERFRGSAVSREDDEAIQSFCLRFVEERAELLRRRQDEGWIRDCHGDLRADHICLTDGIAIFDCIEFEPRFRYRDVAAEIGFLAMDIDYRGHREYAERLVSTYATMAGDRHLPELLPLYQCYLAYIRGKVDSLKSVESEVPEEDRAAARESAAAHFALAYRYTWSTSALVVAVGGLSGSGKTTLAEVLCRRTGFAHFNSDRIRKELAGLPADEMLRGAAVSGLYTDERTDETYAALLRKAGEVLKRRGGVVVDATFQRRSDRDALVEIARDRDVPLLFVECVCAEPEIRRRLDERAARGVGASDADWEIYRTQVVRGALFDEGETVPRLTVDTGGPLEQAVAVVERRCRAIATAGGIAETDLAQSR